MGQLTPQGLVLHDRLLADMDAVTLHRLLKLRCEVFVVEQDCVYADVDDRDAEPLTRHVWLATPTGEPTTYLRRLAEPDGATRLGRVVTAPAWRGRRLAAHLLTTVMADVDGPVVLDAQSHLRAFYEGLGLTVSGPEFMEDGIPHLPMRRD